MLIRVFRIPQREISLVLATLDLYRHTQYGVLKTSGIRLVSMCSSEYISVLLHNLSLELRDSDDDANLQTTKVESKPSSSSRSTDESLSGHKSRVYNYLITNKVDEKDWIVQIKLEAVLEKCKVPLSCFSSIKGYLYNLKRKKNKKKGSVKSEGKTEEPRGSDPPPSSVSDDYKSD